MVPEPGRGPARVGRAAQAGHRDPNPAKGPAVPARPGHARGHPAGRPQGGRALPRARRFRGAPTPGGAHLSEAAPSGRPNKQNVTPDW